MTEAIDQDSNLLVESEPYIEDISDIIINPLLAVDHDINLNDFKQIFILIKTTETIDPNIYYAQISEKKYESISKNLILYKVSKNFLQNNNHKSNILVLPSHILSKFNIYNYNLEDKNIVVLILNIKLDNIKLYLKQYEKETNLDDIFKILYMNKYYNVEYNKYIRMKIIKYINELEEAKYWGCIKNCNVNITSFFKKRKFHLNCLTTTSSEFNNYILDLIKTTKYIDPSITKTINHINYKISYDNIYSKTDINNLFASFNIAKHEKEIYLLLCNLLISKKYCHLVLNNKYILLNYQCIINKYIQVFRYLIGYAWLKFYFEESIKKTFITKEDTFIFDTDTASLLPKFPFVAELYRFNPYMPLLVANNQSIEIANNFLGVVPVKYDNQHTLFNSINKYTNNGICNLEQFKERLNIFTTSKSDKDLFQNINWKELKIAISGSIMPACLQVYNPLMSLFDHFKCFTDRMNRFFNEYYALADIDVMFLTQDVIEFMDNVFILYEKIKTNICEIYSPNAEPNHVKLKCDKLLYLFITKDELKKQLDTNIDMDKIINNLDSDETLTHVMGIVKNEIDKYKTTLVVVDPEKYKDYYDFENIKIKIKLINRSYGGSAQENIFIRVNCKYKIECPHLNHNLELFMVKYNDFFATVQTFHLPCVRAYYDGENAYLTPSCISAQLTYMNIDYKYFAGTQSPIEILNKYRLRGFGTWLNNGELKITKQYVEKHVFWKNLYGTFQTGYLSFNNKIFQPRLYNIDSYDNAIPIDLDLGYNIINLSNNNLINNENDYFAEIDNRFNNLINPNLHFLTKLTTINKDGNINPIQKWIIEAVYEIMNMT
jgi:hypothetical protein